MSQVDVVPGADWAVADLDDPPEQLRESLAAAPREWILLLDAERRPQRWAQAQDLEGDQPGGRAVRCILRSDMNLYEALDAMIVSDVGCATIINVDGRFQEVIDFDALRQTIATFHTEARRHRPATLSTDAESVE